jgi:hypothetical protein
MTKYKIEYNYNGTGTTIIEADTKEEVEAIFDDGDFEPEDEENYNIEIVEIKEVENNGK